MSENAHPLMVMLLAANSFVGPAEVVENEIMPTNEQLNFGVGDAAILASANTALEGDFVVVMGLDPEKHSSDFPDWEERMLNSFVLCSFFSRNDPTTSKGWVSRLKLLPISNYRYRECRRWVKEGFPDPMPEWNMELYRKYTDQLAEQAPGVVPRAVTCEYCGKRNVELVVVRRITYRARCGVLEVEGQMKHLPVHAPDEDDSHDARLVCKDCGAQATLEDDEWKLPNSN